MVNDAPQQQSKNQRADDFVSVYANNVFFEQSVWDLKIIFGELDQSTGVIEQHTAVTVPWTLAKIALYYLATQIAGHEIINGKIALPDIIMPVAPPPISDEQKEDPKLVKVYEAFTRIHDQFMKDV
jgi:hypothetical protein